MSPHPDSIAQLYARHARGLRLHVAKMVGESEAEDVLHDVFERALRALGGHHGEARLSTWLYGIARHAALDRIRARAVRERDDVADAIREGVVAGGPADLAVGRAETRSCLANLLAHLPAAHREILLHSDIRELSDRQTAEALSISVGAARVRLHRARRALRDLAGSACRTSRDERDELACEPIGPRSACAAGPA